MENTKTNYQYLHDDGNWYPIEIKKCNMTRARGTTNQGRPYQPVYIKDGKEHTVRYRRVTIESAITELQAVVEHGDGTCNGKRYRLTPGQQQDPTFKSTGQIRLFVYGTLKGGYWNHDTFCRGAISIEEATVRGRLYELPSGIPVLEVPDEDVLAIGTASPAKDTILQDVIHELGTVPVDSSDWDTICGELITLPCPETSLPPIDRLEGFHPNVCSIYRRVLVCVQARNGRLIPAWCYVCGGMSTDHMRRLGVSWNLSNTS
ncbi:MAG: gamma-glutamylcyclotransferase [Candidatus Marsarchaeota archaeon]|nr:gamma-glutamylcyclotransferase [Candidatus Marsarchaeota archaeon]